MSADSPPAVLLLDVMSTIVRDPFYEDIPGFFGMTLEELLAVKHPTAWVDFEHGRIDAGTYLDTMFEDGRDFDRAGFMRCVRSGYRFLPGMENLLAELLSLSVPMVAVSNYPVWWRLIEAELNLSRFLEWRFVSCETGLRKPDPTVYTSAVSALGLIPEDVLFIDDQPRNCAAAEAVGVPSVLFKGAVALREELRDRGVPLRREP